MCDPILVTLLKMQPHYSQSRRENATPSSGTSPVASYREVPPPPGSQGDFCWGRQCINTHRLLNSTSEIRAEPFQAFPPGFSLLLLVSRWSIVSNALRRSRKTVPVTYPLSILSRTWSVKSIKAVEVERFNRKPNCDCDNNLFSSKKGT